MNILIVDDHPLVCNGISSILRLEDEIDSIRQANDIKTALDIMAQQPIDLALVDMRLKNEKGIDFIALARNKYPQCKFMVLSSSAATADFEQALAAGVDGYILKDAFPEDIVYAVKTVLKDRKYFDSAFVEKQNSGEQLAEQPVNILSPREMEVLLCLAEGMSNKKIADKLYISENTVKKHVSRILEKMNFADRTQAALYASQIVNKNAKNGSRNTAD
ncbi:MAG: response regulator transcription factor [Firmicutes bacterium]|nr:response regulator transcription factor [Bacillota bacterium]